MTYADSDTDRHSASLTTFLPAALPAVIPEHPADLWMRVEARFRAIVGWDVANSLKSLQFSSVRGATVFLSTPHIGLKVMANFHKLNLLHLWQDELPDIQDVQFVVRSAATAKGLAKISGVALPEPEPQPATLHFLPESTKLKPDHEASLALVLQAWQRVKAQYNFRYLSQGHTYSSCPLKFIGVYDDVVSLEMGDHLRDHADDVLRRLLLDCWQEEQPAIQKMFIRRPQGLRVTDMTIMVTSETDIGLTLDKLFENAIYEHSLKNGIGTPQPHRLRIEDIQRIVCKFYGVLRSDMVSNRRTRIIVKPRQVGMYLSKTLTPKSFPEIGRRFGGRDHTTVLHAVRKIEELLLTNTSLAEDIRLLTLMIENPGMVYP